MQSSSDQGADEAIKYFISLNALDRMEVTEYCRSRRDDNIMCFRLFSFLDKMKIQTPESEQALIEQTIANLESLRRNNQSRLEGLNALQNLQDEQRGDNPVESHGLRIGESDLEIEDYGSSGLF
jgi:hypothetical protein